MKTLLTKCVLLLLTLSFVVSCSTNTQNQNTAIGAGTGAVAGGLLGTLAHGAGSGWVIAGGAVLGALIGGYIGHNMDSTDKAQINTVMDTNAIGQPGSWTNPKTGKQYTVTPTSNVMSYHGSSTCRKYTATYYDNGKTKQTRGVACKDANGVWQAVKG